MRSLTLLRHAKSDWGDRGQRDFDRPLNGRGRRAAEVMGAFLKRENLAFDHVIASPAVRVGETIAGVEHALGRPLGAAPDRKVYMASAAILLDLVHAAPPAAERLLLIGHNPGLEDLALMLAAADDPHRADIFEKYPTAALAELAVPGDWATLTEGSARITRFTRPRDLDPSLGSDDS